MKCEKCGAEARVLRVEEDENGADIAYVCANPRCTEYKRECGRIRRERSVPAVREDAGAGNAPR